MTKAAFKTVTERLADYAVQLQFADLPGEAVTKAKEHLLHHLGVAFRGHHDVAGQQALRAVSYLSDGTGTSTVIGERQRAGMLDAVFANSALMSHFGLDDFQMPPGIHPGVQTHPVGLAIGERHHAPGRDYITAVVAGYDVMSKLAAALFPWNLPHPRRPFTLYAPFAGATVAARLLKLSPERTGHALGHAAHYGMGLIEGGRTIRAVQPQIARNGTMAAVLAQAGMPQVRTMIEGEHGLYRSYVGELPDALEESLSTLGSVFEITRASKIEPLDFVEHRDHVLDALVEKVHLRFEPGRPSRYCRIEITTTAHETHAAEADDHVFPSVDWQSWLGAGGQHVLPAHHLDRLIQLIESLEDVDDLATITRLLVPDGDAAATRS